MHQAVASPLDAWGNFYVIVGSSAGALTGLQFVVMTLIAGSPRRTGGSETISAFGTPNIVHFCAALLVASLVSVPWRSLAPVGASVALCGLAGVVYCAIVLRRALRQRDYEPVFEDWLWHSALPALSYAAMLVAGVVLTRAVEDALFAIAGGALLLVFVGIHNAWDTVTFVTMTSGPPSDSAGNAGSARPATSPAAPAVSAGPAAAGSGESPAAR